VDNLQTTVLKRKSIYLPLITREYIIDITKVWISFIAVQCRVKYQYIARDIVTQRTGNEETQANFLQASTMISMVSSDLSVALIFTATPTKTLVRASLEPA